MVATVTLEVTTSIESLETLSSTASLLAAVSSNPLSRYHKLCGVFFVLFFINLETFYQACAGK